MNKAEAIAKLQEQASALIELESMLRANGQFRLSESVLIWRLVNYKVQGIVDEKPRGEVSEALDDLGYDLFSSVEFYRDNRIEHLAELYASALDGLIKAQEKIEDYIGEQE